MTTAPGQSGPDKPATTSGLGGRIAIFAPSGRDGPVIGAMLGRSGIATRVCEDMETFCRCIAYGADAGILTEETLTFSGQQLLTKTLAAQPRWSDIPLILIGGPEDESSPGLFERLAPVANFTLIERPTHPFTLVAAVRAAIRARERQYATRAHLDEITRNREELARHRDDLAAAVSRRTEELHKAYQALQLSERMAAIGTLSAGVGHDIANLLMPVRIRIEELERTMDKDPESLEHVTAIRACVGHLQRLASGLRQLALDPNDSRGTELGTDVGVWWDETEKVLRAALPREVLLTSDIPFLASAESATGQAGRTDPLIAAVAPHQLSQAVFNLVQNAGDALRSSGKKGGTVHVSAQREHATGAIAISVADDGPGMTDEVKRRCLEPLFTTKTRQISTGLGLALVRGIVERAAGSVEIESQVGKGSTFRLLFPAFVRPARRAEKPLRAAVTIADARSRGIVSLMLRSLGFETDVAPPSTGGDAPTIWVADSANASPEILGRFVQGSPDRKVVLLGAPGRDIAHTPGIIAVGDGASSLREALEYATGHR